MENYKIGFIGAGNMASAIIEGLLKNKLYSNNNLIVYDISEERRQYFKSKDIAVADSLLNLLENSRIIFLAIKPQNYESVLTEIKSNVNENKLFVTIAAGISTTYIQNKLGVNCPIVRAMPNTPLLMGLGATAICKSENVSNLDFDTVKAIFATASEVEILPEDKMNEVVSINGSSPAYIYLFVKTMLNWALQKGIDYDVALNLACKTLEGSALMLKESGFTPDELIKMVSSPGGTTLEALKSLNDHRFCETLMEAMDSCAKRAEELSL